MPAAARLTDPVGHSPTMSWLLKGKAVVPVDKISVYARGGVADVSQELRALQHFKQTSRKTFVAEPANAARLKQLKSMQHNYERSAAMARELENVGLTDTPANNEVIIRSLLETGQAVNAQNRVWVPGLLVPHDATVHYLLSERGREILDRWRKRFTA